MLKSEKGNVLLNLCLYVKTDILFKKNRFSIDIVNTENI